MAKPEVHACADCQGIGFNFREVEREVEVENEDGTVEMVATVLRLCAVCYRKDQAPT